jgi:alpha-1,6-mannosyltransferase
MRRGHLSLLALLAGIGAASLIPYGYALAVGNLRLNTIPFEWAFFVAFGLYALASWLVLQTRMPVTPRAIGLIFSFAILFRVILVFSPPTLSDDMYRYVWDGRVQAYQINPYTYPPAAPELAHLRDSAIWPLINRKPAVTVYPAGAELAFAALWRVWPDNVHWFQAAMVGGDLMAAVLLVFLLRALGRSPAAVLIYLWNPLVIFEIAHSAHVDGLVLPLLVGTWLARLKGRDGLTGLLLGVAAALKLYPVLLLPIVWRRQDEQGRFRPAVVMPLAFLIGLGLPYLPYLAVGQSVVGFLPQYFGEQFNSLLTVPIAGWVYLTGGRRPELVINPLIAAVLLAIYLVCLFRPAVHAETALRRCLWPIGAFTLLTQNLYPWYVLWLVPLLAIFLPSRQAESPATLAWRLLHTSWTGWWLFSGLVALAYTYYIQGWPNLVAMFTEFIPLYEFLVIDLTRWLKSRFRRSTVCRA